MFMKMLPYVKPLKVIIIFCSYDLKLIKEPITYI
jgi:hypothetical protein